MSVTNELPPWRLVIAGPDEQGTLKALKEQAARLGLEDSVVFAGPVYGEEKWRLLRSADLFVLPTRSENFGIVVAEALAAGVPVVCTKGAPWEELLGYCDHAPGARLPDGVRQSLRRGLVVAMTSVKRDARLGAGSCRAEEVVAMTSVKIEEGRCGWWVDVDAEPLAEALREAMTLTDAERREMGENGRRLVEAKYRWESVARDMCRVYEGIIATMPRARACRTESGKASAGA